MKPSAGKDLQRFFFRLALLQAATLNTVLHAVLKD